MLSEREVKVIVTYSSVNYKDAVVGYDNILLKIYGGFSEVVHIPADWIIPLPEGLTLRESMVLGTAGITGALSIHNV